MTKVQATLDDIALGDLAITSGSYELMGRFADRVGPRLLQGGLGSPDDFRLICMGAVIAPYFAGGKFAHDIKFCAEHNLSHPENDRDWLYTTIAKGQPSGSDVERSLHLPAPYNWFAATQWTRILHKSRALSLLEMCSETIMAGPQAPINADFEYEKWLYQCACEDLWLRKNPHSPKMNLSGLLATFPSESENPTLYRARMAEAWRMFGLRNWKARRDRVK